MLTVITRVSSYENRCGHCQSMERFRVIVILCIAYGGYTTRQPEVPFRVAQVLAFAPNFTYHDQRSCLHHQRIFLCRVSRVRTTWRMPTTSRSKAPPSSVRRYVYGCGPRHSTSQNLPISPELLGKQWTILKITQLWQFIDRDSEAARCYPITACSERGLRTVLVPL